MMRCVLGILVLTGMSLLFGTTARADGEIVIAIRYLQAEGTSHSHLYLFRERGELLRQLTNDDSGQDSAPIFSPDGSIIVFTREKSNNTREFWSVDPLGKALKKLDAAPNWYASAKSSPYFTNVDSAEPPAPDPAASPEASPSPTPTPIPSYKSPDGSVELILHNDPTDEDDQGDGPGHGKHYLLRDVKTGSETEFGKLPGFYGVYGLLHDSQDKDQHFLFEGPLRLAFFDLHLNSTDGDTVFALDLNGSRLVRLSTNWAAPIPLPGDAAFLTFTENRYVPIPGSKKTANCSYIEHWDEKLNKIRYGREKSAALCYGASMYRPGNNPGVITVRRTAD
ncbi:MAG: hypothetical protein DME65_14170 [Verrucomicrobia bacterium]|nr:MAG: hypothetical protein DME65_14170 [Verrucomicrobiota bacterium]